MFFIKFVYVDTTNEDTVQNIIINSIVVCIVIFTFFLAIQAFTSNTLDGTKIVYENKFKYIVYLILFIISLKMVYTLHMAESTKDYLQSSFGPIIIASTFGFNFIFSMLIYYFKFANKSSSVSSSTQSAFSSQPTILNPKQSFSKMLFILIGFIIAFAIAGLVFKLYTLPTITNTDSLIPEKTMSEMYAFFNIKGIGFGIILLIILFLIGIHTYFKEELTAWDKYMKVLVIISGMILNVGFILLICSYFGLTSINSIPFIPNTSINYILKILIVCIALAIIYKVIQPYIPTGSASSVVSFITNIIFFIPHILITIVDFGANLTNNTNGTTLKLLFIEIVAIILYFFLPTIISFFSQSSYNGKLLVTNVENTVQNTVNSLLNLNASAIPIGSIKDMIRDLPNHIKNWELNGINEIATIGQLNLSTNPIYNYAISLWLYIEPNQHTKTYTSILNYGNKQLILYKSRTNSLSFVVSGSTGPQSCTTSKYGCCDNTDIYKNDELGSNCTAKSCETSPFGCCASINGGAPTYKIDKLGMNCPSSNATCGSSEFGC